jgi:hypothetical protein
MRIPRFSMTRSGSYPCLGASASRPSTVSSPSVRLSVTAILLYQSMAAMPLGSGVVGSISDDPPMAVPR